MRYLFFAFLLFHLSGCSDEDHINQLTPSLEAERLHISSLTRSDRLVYMSNLSPQRKHALWTNKMDQVLKLNVWTDEQLQIISNLYDQLSVDIFVRNSDAFKQFAEFEPKWLETTQHSFSHKQFSSIFKSLATYEVNDEQIGPGSPGGPGNVDPCDDCVPEYNFYCSCSTESDWCSNGGCTSGTCAFFTDGCGTLWWYICNGLCAVI